MAYIFLQLPTTNPNTIVFPSSDEGFDLNAYSPVLTDGRASTEEVVQVLKELESLKRPLSKRKTFTVIAFILIFLSLGVGFGVTLNIIITRRPTLIGVVIAPFFIFLFLGILCFMGALKRIRDEQRKGANAVISQANLVFASKGLRWVLPYAFPNWIELWKDYAMPSNSNSSYYVPPHEGQYSHFQRPGSSFQL